MSFLGSLTSFVAGAAAGAAGGIIGSRLLAPGSGADMQQTLQDRKNEIAVAGEMAKTMAETRLEQQYRATVAERASARETR